LPDFVTLPPELPARLLAWFAANARILPWREDRTPYKVWVSEIMLQQTRVEAVKEYFVRFTGRFPDTATLAAADENEVLKYWEGLGYYSRARNLHRAAQMIQHELNGVFPSDLAALRKLPGVGAYTAGAVSSIAFGNPDPAVDGNVLRVLSRLTGSLRSIDDEATKEMFTRALRQIYPAKQASDFTESLMELGALICIPNGEPLCDACPLVDLCLAKAQKLLDRIPVKKAKAKRQISQMTVLLLTAGGKIALRKRPAKGLLAKLWEFPNFDSAEKLRDFLTLHRLDAAKLSPAGSHRHIFTHREWEMTGYRLEIAAPVADLEWFTLKEIRRDIAIPGAFQPFLDVITAK